MVARFWWTLPELPEVETIARGLDRRVKGDVIESLWLGSKPEPLKSPAAEIVATLESKKILGVRRMGKHIVFDLERTGVERARSSAKASKSRAGVDQWIVHLGMTGRMLVCAAKRWPPPSPSSWSILS